MKVFGYIALVLCWAFSPIAKAVELTTVQLNPQSNALSMVFKFNGPVAFKAFTLPDPERVVVDLERIELNLNLQQIVRQSSWIHQVRSGRPAPNKLRLVFDMNRPVSVQTTYISNQLQIQLRPKGPMNSLAYHHSRSTKRTSPLIPVLKTSPASRKRQRPIHVRHSPGRSSRDVIIVLDAGHGGKDPGAIGAMRHAEKQVTLNIARKLKQVIDRQPGMRAVLTRTGDYYVGLRERLQIARRYNADIFISIHADAFINQHSHGASVFALSQNGATSEAARWLAEKENYSELGGVNLSDLDDKLVRTVLIDLSQTATIGASLQMGTQVLRQLDHMTNLHNNKVEQARFMVLKSPDIPSILIETGFISNPMEERNLTSPAYQLKLTQAILNGLKSYFWEHPPQGTRMETLVMGGRR